MMESQGLFGCELEPNLTQMDLETVAAPKCGFRLISSWGENHSPLRTTDMQEIVGCRGLQRPEGAHVANPLEIGSNCLINQCLDDTDSFNGIMRRQQVFRHDPHSVKLAKRFNAAEQFRRALLESRPFCPVLAATYSAWASSQRSIRSFAISERFELSIGSGPFCLSYPAMRPGTDPPCASAVQTGHPRQYPGPPLGWAFDCRFLAEGDFTDST